MLQCVSKGVLWDPGQSKVGLWVSMESYIWFLEETSGLGGGLKKCRMTQEGFKGM